MDERLVSLLRGINGVLTDFSESVEDGASQGYSSNLTHAMLKDLSDAIGMMYDVDRTTFEGILIDTHDRYALICDIPKYSGTSGDAAPSSQTSEEVTASTVAVGAGEGAASQHTQAGDDDTKSEKILDVIVDPEPVPPPFEPDVNQLPDQAPVPTPETMQDPVPPPSPSDKPANPTIVFPLTVEQVRQTKRADLRNIVSDLGLEIVGEHGEPASEMMVKPLRDAVIKYIAGTTHQDADSTTLATPDDEQVAAPPQEVDETTTTESVDDLPITEAAPAGTISKGGLLFESWVAEQAGGIVAGGTEVSQQRAVELADFFKENMPYVQGKDREPLEQYFKKMGCEYNCKSCPNGNMQPMYCYGVFDEEVTHISLHDAVNSEQFFKISEKDGQIEYAHTPS